MVMESILASAAAWLSTSAVFIGIPVVRSLRADVRAAEASGLPHPKNVARRRFFIPHRKRPLHAALLNRVAWIECSTTPAHEKRAARVTAVRTASLTFDDGSVFEPRAMSRGFADGTGAATGTIAGIPTLVIFT